MLKIISEMRSKYSKCILKYSQNTFLEITLFFQLNDLFEMRGMKYFFSRHIDGHHKLTRWKVVIHGAVVAYKQMITYLQ